MKPTETQQETFERFLEEIKTPEDREKAMEEAVVRLRVAIQDGEWGEMAEIALEFLASAAYMNFITDLQ